MLSDQIIDQINNNLKSKKWEEEDNVKLTKKEYNVELVWRNVILMIFIHVSGVYGLYLGMTQAKIRTLIFTAFVSLFSAFGVLVSYIMPIVLYFNHA